MALAKRVKIGGSAYFGYVFPVSSGVGDYLLAISPTANNFAVSGMSITPSSGGNAQDSFSVAHVSTTSTAGGKVVAQLATNIYNLGAQVTIGLDLASLELVNPGESLRFTYHNVATRAMNIFVTVETIK